MLHAAGTAWKRAAGLNGRLLFRMLPIKPTPYAAHGDGRLSHQFGALLPQVSWMWGGFAVDVGSHRGRMRLELRGMWDRTRDGSRAEWALSGVIEAIHSDVSSNH